MIRPLVLLVLIQREQRVGFSWEKLLHLPIPDMLAGGPTKRAPLTPNLPASLESFAFTLTWIPFKFLLRGKERVKRSAAQTAELDEDLKNLQCTRAWLHSATTPTRCDQFTPCLVVMSSQLCSDVNICQQHALSPQWEQKGAWSRLRHKLSTYFHFHENNL